MARKTNSITTVQTSLDQQDEGGFYPAVCHPKLVVFNQPLPLKKEI